MRLEPLHDRIVIRPTPPDAYRGGLQLMSSDMQDKNEGTVVSVGPGVPLHNIKLEVTGEVTEAAMDKLLKVVELIENGRKMKVSPGDYVMYGRYAGTKIVLNEVDHVMIRESDVFGKLIEE